MKSLQKIVVVNGCLGLMLGAFGCANKDIVKKDETIDNKTATSNVKKTDQKKNDSDKSGTIVPAESSAKSNQSNKNASNQSANNVAAQSEFEKIYFNFDSTDLSKEARESLTRNGEILLKKRKDVKLSIEGNCDERGSAEYNLALGERRAKAAAKYLETMGVKQERISTISFGKERPAVQGDNEAAWSRNRRDEFLIRN